MSYAETENFLDRHSDGKIPRSLIEDWKTTHKIDVVEQAQLFDREKRKRNAKSSFYGIVAFIGVLIWIPLAILGESASVSSPRLPVFLELILGCSLIFIPIGALYGSIYYGRFDSSKGGKARAEVDKFDWELIRLSDLTGKTAEHLTWLSSQELKQAARNGLTEIAKQLLVLESGTPYYRCKHSMNKAFDTLKSFNLADPYESYFDRAKAQLKTKFGQEATS